MSRPISSSPSSEQLTALGARRAFHERPSQIDRGLLRSAAGARARSGPPQDGADGRIGGWRHEQDLGGSSLGLVDRGEQPSGAAVQHGAIDGLDRLVDRGSHDGMRELEHRRQAQQLGAPQHRCRRGRR
jgi:hypothetical protein